MFVNNHYMINEDCMCMTGQFDRYGRLCTLVYEKSLTFFVNQSPLEILAYSIDRIGYELKGAINSSKRMLGQGVMLPIMVNPIHKIVLFPTRSPKHIDNMWFNPYHIKRTKSHSFKTIVQFSNDKSIIIPKRLSSFNNQMQIAEQYKKMILEAATKPRTYYLDSAK